MRRLLPWTLPLIALVIVVTALSAVSAALGDPIEHYAIGALGSVQFVLNTNAATLTSAMAVLIALVLLTVQLTAQRYSFSILSIFVQDPVNVVLIGLFLVTIIFNLWLGLILKETYIPTFAVLTAMGLMTVCFAILPPYILYLFEIVRPDSILDHVQQLFLASVTPLARVEGPRQIERRRELAARHIAQMGDIARTAVGLSDGAVARHSVWALYRSIARYLERKHTLSAEWFAVDGHQFRGRHELIVSEIEATMTWVEVRMLDELREVFTATLNRQHDVNNTVALVLRMLGEKAVEVGDRGLSATILKVFNTLLRVAINQGDVRAGYHVLYQYRLLADAAMSDRPDLTVLIAHRISYYGDAAAGGPLLWMAAAAAYDLRILAERAHQRGAAVEIVRAIVHECIDTVRRGEAKSSPALPQLYKMAIALGAYFVHYAELDHDRAIADGLKGVPRAVLDHAVAELAAVDDPVFWELTDRVVNFDYVDEPIRACLAVFAEHVALASVSRDDGPLTSGAAAPILS